MSNFLFIFLGAFTVAFATVSKLIKRSVISAPIIFVAFGMLLGSQYCSMLSIDHNTHVVKLLVELTLVLVLFTDASRVNLSKFKNEYDLPSKMLSLGLPLTIILGAGLAMLIFPELSIWEAALLSTLLAPTDAALSQSVVSSEEVPMRIRQTINVESGLNDGIVFPVVLLLIGLTNMSTQNNGSSYWLDFSIQQILLGAFIGILVAATAGKSLAWASKKGWVDRSFEQIAIVGIALLCFALATVLGGNGFIAAFCGGMTLGNICRATCFSTL